MIIGWCHMYILSKYSHGQKGWNSNTLPLLLFRPFLAVNTGVLQKVFVISLKLNLEKGLSENSQRLQKVRGWLQVLLRKKPRKQIYCPIGSTKKQIGYLLLPSSLEVNKNKCVPFTWIYLVQHFTCFGCLFTLLRCRTIFQNTSK